MPKTPVKAGSPVPAVDSGTGVIPFGPGEHPLPEPDSSIGERKLFEEESAPKAAPSLPLTLRMIHEKLIELYKLCLKHRHMNLDQKKRRTAALPIPKEIYNLYDQLVKKCPMCQEHTRAPSRAKVSRFHLEVFSNFTFADHDELPIPGKKEKFIFLIFYDGAINLLIAEVIQDTEDNTTLSLITEYFENYQINPKVIVTNQTFMIPHMEVYYNRQNGPRTP